MEQDRFVRSNGNRERKQSKHRGNLVGQKPALKTKKVWAIRVRLELRRELRALALFNFALDSKLRGGDPAVSARMARQKPSAIR